MEIDVFLRFILWTEYTTKVFNDVNGENEHKKTTPNLKHPTINRIPQPRIERVNLLNIYERIGIRKNLEKKYAIKMLNN